MRSQAGRHDPSPADNAGRWANYSHGDRDLRAANRGIPPWARFRSLAWAGPRATLDRRQAGSRENFQNGAARYSSLLITGAMVIVRWACRKGAQEGTWLHRMLGRKPRMLVAIALANKMARSIWAMLTKREDYRGPVAAAF